MAEAKGFSSIELGSRFDKAYKNLPESKQKQADRAIEKLFTNPAHPGLRTHPVKSDKYYWEAYINHQGDRLIYHPEGSHLKIVDIVKHDEIDRYGHAP